MVVTETLAIIISAKESVTAVLKDIGAKLQGLGPMAGKVGSSVAKGLAGIGIAATAALGAFVVSSINAAMEAEKVSFRVQQTFGAMSAQVLAASQQMQDASVYDSEVISQAFVDLQTRTASLGLTVQEQMVLIQGAMDVAAQSGKDFGDVTNAIAAGLTGQTKGLKELGIQLQDGASQGDIYAAVMGRIGSAEGAAQEQTTTLAGAVEQLKNMWGDVQKQVGIEFQDDLKELMQLIMENKDFFIDFGGAVIKILNGVLWIIHQVDAALWAMANVGDKVITRLQMVKELATGKLSLSEFNAQEKNLSERSATDYKNSELIKQEQFNKVTSPITPSAQGQGMSMASPQVGGQTTIVNQYIQGNVLTQNQLTDAMSKAQAAKVVTTA